MALNLWKVGGKSTSYNPLPIGVGNTIQLNNIGSYVVKFKAKCNRESGTLFLQWDDGGQIDEFNALIITNQLVEYTWSFTTNKPTPFYLIDQGAWGDIVVQDIELVQKPLPTLTINGIDGFNSGKWNFGSNAQVIDDTTLRITSTGTNVDSELIIPCLPNTTYIFSYDGDGAFWVERRNSSNTYINGTLSSIGNVIFTTESNATFIRFALFGKNTTPGTVTYKNVMLNLGTIPAPYEKKRGERMMLPVAKKNLIKPNATAEAYSTSPFSISKVVGGTYDGWNKVTINSVVNDGSLFGFINGGSSINKWYPFQFNKDYSMQIEFVSTSNNVVLILDGDLSTGNMALVSNTLYAKTFKGTVSNPALTVFFKASGTVNIGDYFYYKNVQLEQNSSATPYTTYAVQLNPKPKRAIVSAKTGLSFNFNGQITLPSMTMDAIEIECVIDSANTSSILIDARTGLSGGYMYHEGSTGGGFIRRYVDGVLGSAMIQNQRIKLRVESTLPFTDDVNIFGSYTFNERAKGILYKVTCYLNGTIVAQYDFENPANIVGDKILPSAKNLIPSFEDARWSLHANAKVLGKDVLRLESTTTVDQINKIYIPCESSKSYLMSFTGNGYLYLATADQSQQRLIAKVVNQKGGFYQFTTESNAKFIEINLYNASFTGTFDFIKPQLYALDGTEGTIVGSPVSLLKTAKANRYAKR